MKTKVMLFLPLALCFACIPCGSLSSAFLLPQLRSTPSRQMRSFQCMSSECATHRNRSSSAPLHAAGVSITLEKPLGLLLEEFEENAPNGVKIQALSESGSAFASPLKNKLVGCKILKVMEDDVSCLPFDDVMEKLVNAPSLVVIEVDLPVDVDTDPFLNINKSSLLLEIGTTVPVTVIQEGKGTTTFDAKVGDNLRLTLLQNNVELYRGLKKKIGNCGGAGQCTFCAVDMVDSQGWEPRSDYENQKISKWPNARLACLTNIQGPCTIRLQ
jgi:ferredoxin